VYLLYLGVSTLLSSNVSFNVGNPVATAQSPASLYLKGFLVGASNPKALIFFAALFPQFVNPAAQQVPQFLILGATFICFELFWLMFYAIFAARIAPWLRVKGRAKMFNRVSGLTFIGAGALLAATKR
jgi:threonine/homoserine/homoserine lactone efflux protein